jgi:hypothetical protein
MPAAMFSKLKIGEQAFFNLANRSQAKASARLRLLFAVSELTLDK